MTSFGILEQAEEDALHAVRLLNIEEKVFKRVSKRLLTPDTVLFPQSQISAKANPEQPPSDITADVPHDPAREFKLNQWRNDALLDFAAFEANIVRVQFLVDSNDRERQRYTDEKSRIQETAQAVRENNTRLNAKLSRAEATRDLRKTFDALADDITSKKMLKPRQEQGINLQKLAAEIADLEREQEEYRQTWRERREQFERIVEEGRNMLRLIKDEKEEAERLDDAGSETDGTPKAAGPGTPQNEEQTARDLPNSNEEDTTEPMVS